MSFLDKIKQAISSGGPQLSSKIQEMKKDRRYNQRYALPESNIVQLKLQGQLFSAEDISYGGMAIAKTEHTEKLTKSGSPTSGELFTPITSVTCGFEFVRENSEENSSLGLVFHHESRDSLIFLRDVIEPLRLGSTMQLVAKDLLKEEKITENVTYMRGEGPCSLTYKNTDEFILLFPLQNGEYGEVRLAQGHLRTCVTSGSKSSKYAGQNINETSRLDESMVVTACFIIAGSCEKNSSESQKILDNLQATYAQWRLSKKSA